MPTPDLPAPGPVAPSREEARAALERVLASPAFQRGPRLREFLTFIAGMTLEGRGDEINETLISLEVFRRKPEGDDAIVRRQAHALRGKLRDYYASEGAADRVLVELPVGRYVPEFRFREGTPAPVAAPAGAGDAAPPVAAPGEAPTARAPGPRRLLLGLGACALLAVGWTAGVAASRWRAPSAAPPGRAASGLAAGPAAAGSSGTLDGVPGRAAPASAVPPAVGSFWGAFAAAAGSAPVILAVSSRPAAEVLLSSGREAVDELPLPMRSRAHALLAREFPALATRPLSLAPRSSFVSVGDANGAIRMAAWLTRVGATVEPTPVRYVSRLTLRRSAVIFVGDSAINDWPEELLAHQPFRVEHAPGRAPRILNATPGPGEAAAYEDDALPEGGPREPLALVSWLSSPEWTFPVLVVQGLAQRGTDAALRMLTEPDALAGLVARLEALRPASPTGWRFQAVVRPRLRDAGRVRDWILALRML